MFSLLNKRHWAANILYIDIQADGDFLEYHLKATSRIVLSKMESRGGRPNSQVNDCKEKMKTIVHGQS